MFLRSIQNFFFFFFLTHEDICGGLQQITSLKDALLGRSSVGYVVYSILF